MRSRTHLRKPLPHLAILSTEILTDLLKPYNIHVLDFTSDSIDFRVLLSLLPTESISAAASKTKGRISKWLGEQVPSPIQTKSLARGYFAITTGQSVTDAVEAYLDTQSDHHGYADRVRPPVFVRKLEHTDETLHAIQTDHAASLLRYHIVLATWFRRGVFDENSAEAIANDWVRIQGDHGFLVDKVSFVPDHVHIALSLHPKSSPAEVVVSLMNVAQEAMWNFFESEVIKSGVERLWQASAYVGSFGDLSSNAVSGYMNRWSGMRD